MSNKVRRHPKIFISYSHDSPEHVARILALSNRLRIDGLDCELDQYIQCPPKGWPNWMLDQIEEADYVLIVCTKTYHDRFRGRAVGAVGKGAVWEGAIVTQEIYADKGQNKKFVPLVLTATDTQHIPTILRSTTYYKPTETAGYEQLCRRLTGQHDTKKPQLGNLPSLPPKSIFAPILQHPIDLTQGQLWWKRYHNHVYGAASVIALLLTIVALIAEQVGVQQPSPTKVDRSTVQPISPTGLNVPINDQPPDTFKLCSEECDLLKWREEGKAIRIDDNLWIRVCDNCQHDEIPKHLQMANESLSAADSRWVTPTLSQLKELHCLYCAGATGHKPGDLIWSSNTKPFSAYALCVGTSQQSELLKDERAYAWLTRSVPLED